MISITEVESLDKHDRIKFVGDPSRYDKEEGFSPVVGKVYTLSHKPWIEKKTPPYIANLYFYKFGPPFTKDKQKNPSYSWSDVNDSIYYPEDWEFVTSRHEKVVAATKNKLGMSGFRRTLVRAEEDIKQVLISSASKVEYYLGNVNLADKMKLLSGLDPRQKALADFLFEEDTDKLFDKVIERWIKGEEDESR